MQDSVYGHFKGYNKMDFLIHHLVSAGILIYVILRGKYARETLWLTGIAESTGPILNIGRIFEYNEHRPDIQQNLDLLFLFSFIIIRTFSIGFVHDVLLFDNDVVVCFCMLSIWILSMHWSWLMVHKAAKTLA